MCINKYKTIKLVFIDKKKKKMKNQYLDNFVVWNSVDLSGTAGDSMGSAGWLKIMRSIKCNKTYSKSGDGYVALI